MRFSITNVWILAVLSGVAACAAVDEEEWERDPAIEVVGAFHRADDGWWGVEYVRLLDLQGEVDCEVEYDVDALDVSDDVGGEPSLASIRRQLADLVDCSEQHLETVGARPSPQLISFEPEQDKFGLTQGPVFAAADAGAPLERYASGTSDGEMLIYRRVTSLYGDDAIGDHAHFNGDDLRDPYEAPIERE